MTRAAFAPFPLRAINDTRLTALELRVLAKIAYHDRLSGPRGKGRGCVASHLTLAAAVDCDYTRLSAAITVLVDHGYVIREQGQTDRRQRIYRVIHDATDSLPVSKLNGLPNRKASQESSLPEGNQKGRDSLPVSPSDDSQATKNVDCSKPNIFSETVIDGAEALRRDSVETALSTKADAPIGNVGAQLARFERRLKRHALAPHEQAVWIAHLQRLAEELPFDDANRGRAERLIQEIAA